MAIEDIVGGKYPEYHPREWQAPTLVPIVSRFPLWCLVYGSHSHPMTRVFRQIKWALRTACWLMWWQTLGGKLGNEHFDFHHLQPAREHLQYWLQRKTFNHEGVLVSARRLLGRDLIEFGNGVDTQLPPTPYIPHRGEYTFIPTQAQVDECSLFDWGEPPVIDLAVMRYAERLTGSERYALLSPREYALWSLYKKLPAYALVNSRKLIWGEDYDEHASAIVRKCY